MWYFLIGVLSGFIIGIIPVSLYLRNKKKAVGDLIVDRSDEDGPLLFLELNIPLTQVEESDQVELKVVHKNYISQN